MAADLPRRRLADPATGRCLGDHRPAARRPAGHRPRLAAPGRARTALCLHLLLPRHPSAGAAVSRLLRPGAVRRGAPERPVAVPAGPLLVRHHHHDDAHRGLHRRDPARRHPGGSARRDRGRARPRHEQPADPLAHPAAARRAHRPAGLQQRGDPDAQGQRPRQHHHPAGADRRGAQDRRAHLRARANVHHRRPALPADRLRADAGLQAGRALAARRRHPQRPRTPAGGRRRIAAPPPSPPACP